MITLWRASMIAQDLSPATVRLRVYQLTAFAEHHPDLLAVTAEDLTVWLARPGWSTETRRSQRGALRGFYRWAYATGRTGRDPGAGLPRIRPAQRQPRPASSHDVRLGMIAADARVRLMLTLAVRQGLRRGEVAQVHSRDLVEDLGGWSLIVHGKGRKERLVPLAGDVADQLRALPPGWAFPGVNGHLTAGHVGRLMAQALPGDVTAHQLRHAFATRAYRGTGDLLAVQRLLGHARPETTQRYIAVEDDALRRAVLGAA